MSAPYDTIALNYDTWDAFVDTSGNIATRNSGDAVSQDMGSACRLFLGEYIFNKIAGIPFRTIFGQTPSLPVLKSDYVTAASKIPGTSNVVCYITGVADRAVSGQVQADVVDENGSKDTIAASIIPIPLSG